LTRSTQNPFSGLWNVTRSTRPAKASVAAVGAKFAMRSALPRNRPGSAPLTSNVTDQQRSAFDAGQQQLEADN
jgi:hypothetical protein